MATLSAAIPLPDHEIPLHTTIHHPDGGISIESTVPYETEWADCAAEQTWLNDHFADLAADHATDLAADLTADLVRRLARRRHAEYPQYEGHWDGPEWRLVRVRRQIRTKGGIRFEEGDITLSQRRPSLAGFRSHETAYSLRGTIDCSVDCGDVEVIR